MTRAVYVGGLLGGEAGAEKVADALLDTGCYEDVDPYTYAEAKRCPWKVAKAVKGVTLVTHSAGIEAAQSTQPNRVHAFAAPYQRGRLLLALLSVPKSLQMVLPAIRSKADRRAMLDYHADVTQGFWEDKLGNLVPFLMGDISKFDTVGRVGAWQAEGIQVTLAHMTNDIYFPNNYNFLGRAHLVGAQIVPLLGVHDELPLRPDEVLSEYFSKVDD